MKNYMTITDSKYKVNIKILRQWIEGGKDNHKKKLLLFDIYVLSC